MFKELNRELRQMKLCELIDLKERLLKSINKLSQQITDISKEDLTKQYSNVFKMEYNAKLISDKIEYIKDIDDVIQYICEYSMR